MVFVDVVLVAVVLGRLLGGRVSALGDVRLHGTWLAFCAVALQAVAFPLGVFPWHTPSDVSRALWVLSYALLVALLVRNRHLTGAPLLAAGLAANVAAILANGGLMPVRASALAAAGRTYRVHENSIAAAHPQLAVLVDRWAVPRWLPLGNVYSIGDVLIALGVAIVVVTAMRSGNASPAVAEAQAGLPG